MRSVARGRGYYCIDALFTFTVEVGSMLVGLTSRAAVTSAHRKQHVHVQCMNAEGEPVNSHAA